MATANWRLRAMLATFYISGMAEFDYDVGMRSGRHTEFLSVSRRYWLFHRY